MYSITLLTLPLLVLSVVAQPYGYYIDKSDPNCDDASSADEFPKVVQTTTLRYMTQIPIMVAPPNPTSTG